MRAIRLPLLALVAGLLAAPAAAAPGPRALAFLSDVVHGREGTVVADFNPQMREALSAARLQAAWAAYELQFGSYVGHGEAEIVPLGTSTVVRIPLRMSREQGEFRITFEAGGEIAGLYFLRTGVPL